MIYHSAQDRHTDLAHSDIAKESGPSNLGHRYLKEQRAVQNDLANDLISRI